jgi:hypothetical protein
MNDILFCENIISSISLLLTVLVELFPNEIMLPWTKQLFLSSLEIRSLKNTYWFFHVVCLSASNRILTTDHYLLNYA